MFKPALCFGYREFFVKIKSCKIRKSDFGIGIQQSLRATLRQNKTEQQILLSCYNIREIYFLTDIIFKASSKVNSLSLNSRGMA